MTIQLELILRLSAAMPCRSTFTLSTPFWLEGKWRRLSCAMNGENWGIFYTSCEYTYTCVSMLCSANIHMLLYTPLRYQGLHETPSHECRILDHKESVSLLSVHIFYHGCVRASVYTVTNIYHMKCVYCSHILRSQNTCTHSIQRNYSNVLPATGSVMLRTCGRWRKFSYSSPDSHPPTHVSLHAHTLVSLLNCAPALSMSNK